MQADLTMEDDNKNKTSEFEADERAAYAKCH